MEAQAINPDLEHAPHIVPLLDPPSQAEGDSCKRPLKGTLMIIGSIVFLISLVALIISQRHEPLRPSKTESISVLLRPRGVDEGVSAKSNPSLNSQKASYNWTNAMLSWQRTAFHFQPEQNWMNGKQYASIFGEL